MDKYQYISYTHFIETYIIRISKLQFHHGVVLQFETKKNFDNFGCLYRRFINRIQNFARIKGSLFPFVVLVAKTWNASSWCKYTYRRSQSTAAISKMAKGREGKERRIIKVVDSSFRFTRVVRFASATGQFFSCHASRWFLVRRYPRDLRFQAYVHTCISLFLKSIRPWWRLFNQPIVRSPRVPFLTPSYPSFFLPDFSNRVSFMGEKWNRVEKWTRWNVNVARKTKFSYNL